MKGGKKEREEERSQREKIKWKETKLGRRKGKERGM